MNQSQTSTDGLQVNHGTAQSSVAPAGQQPATQNKAPIVDDQPTPKKVSLWTDAWAQLRKSPSFILGAILSLVFTVMAIAPGLFTSKDPTDVANCDVLVSKLPPGEQGYLLGTSIQGCDYFGELIYSARASMTIALLVVIGMGLLGTLIGALAGYFGGWVDGILSRLTDVFYGLPGILVILLASRTLFADKPKTAPLLALIMVVFGWMTAARLVRSGVVSVRESDYIAAAKALGANSSRIIGRHVLPNCIAPLIVLLTLSFGGFIAAEAALTYLGVGLDYEIPSWGRMINQGKDWLETAPHLVMIPGITLSFAVLAFILMGDALREALDPKARK